MSTTPPDTTEAATVLPPDVTRETDDDLLVMMSWSGSDHGTPEAVAARASWGEFYVRHREFLFFACRRWGADAADVVSETFRRVRTKAKQFPHSRLAGVTDPEERVNVVRAWLGTIAMRVGVDIYRVRTRAGEVLDPCEMEERFENDSRTRPTVDSGRVERVARAVRDVLTDREREVVTATMRYYSVERGQSAMPSEEVVELARRLGMTRESIRKTRERAYEKLRVRLEQA